MISWMRWSCFTLVLVGATTAAQADLVISIGSTSIPVGGMGTVDVMISSTTGSEILNSYGFEFQITPNNGSVLEFTDPQSSSELANPNYIFATFGSAGSAPLGAVGPGTTYIGANVSNDPVGETVTVLPHLLATLDLSSLSGTVGDTFTISLIGSAADLNDNTFFWDNNTNDFAFTSPPGTITLTANAAAVPEPASLILAALTAGGLGLIHLRRRQPPHTAKCNR